MDTCILYNKYQCWNKDCKAKDTPFVVLNGYIKDEDLFDGGCDSCHESFHREFVVDGDNNLLLQFQCNGKLCESNIDPYSFNLKIGEWEGISPKIVLYDDSAAPKGQKFERDIKKNT